MHIITLTNVSIEGKITPEKLEQTVDEKLDKFYYDNEKYYEFEEEDQEKLKKEYNDEIVTAIKLPDGSIKWIYDFMASARLYFEYIVVDGKLYKTHFGKAGLQGRSKFCKKTKIITSLLSKFIPFGQAMTMYFDYDFNPETNTYGHFYNPYGLYDWYMIGGRWKNMLLVEESCTDCIELYMRNISNFYIKHGENIERYEFNGKKYKFVLAAKKKDIQWDILREYIKEQKLDFIKNIKYPFLIGGIFKDGDYIDGNVDDNTIDEYLSTVDDEDYLVTVDIHQ